MNFMKTKLPKRKPNRLENFDYGAGHAYFVTICTKNRQNLFWKSVGACIARPQDVPLTSWGKIVDDAISNIPLIYPQVSVDHYVIMPNHIHLLINIYCEDENGRAMLAPTLSRVVQQMKGAVTKATGMPIWQKLFYDHVIRNKQDYEEISKYIYENPINWETDELYN